MSLMKSDRTKAPKSDRIAGYAIIKKSAVSTTYAKMQKNSGRLMLGATGLTYASIGSRDFSTY